MGRISRIAQTMIPFLGILGILLGYSVFWGDESFVQRMTREDGVVENIGAAMFFLAGFCFLLAFLKSGSAGEGCRQRRERRNVWYLLLCVAMLFIFLEEISWGQRAFHWRTPEFYAKANLQDETNVHNLTWFDGRESDGSRKGFWKLLINADRLFSVFCVGLGVVLPLAHMVSRRAKRVITKVRLPVMSLSVGLLFLVSYGVSKWLEAAMPPRYEGEIVEAKESIAAWLLLCLGGLHVLRMRAKGRAVSDAAQGSGAPAPPEERLTP